MASRQIEHDPRKQLMVGFDTAGNLLEIIAVLEDDGMVVVVHAMRCRKSYLSLLKGRRR